MQSYQWFAGIGLIAYYQVLERHPNIKTVYLALNNDQAGQLATWRLTGLVREQGLEADALVHVMKDEGLEQGPVRKFSTDHG